MQTNKLANYYGFKLLIELYDYIFESKMNGQHKQAKEIFFELSDGMRGERADCLVYIKEIYNEDLTAYFYPSKKI